MSGAVPQQTIQSVELPNARYTIRNSRSTSSQQVLELIP